MTGTGLDNRLQALTGWIKRTLNRADLELRPASADASFRRYYRVRSGAESYIVVDAPPDKEDMSSFIRIADRFRALGLNVPRILAHDPAQGFALITDLGDRLYLDHLTETTVERLYRDALGALVVLQAGTYAPDDFLPDYDSDLLHREMELFREWYLSRHLGLRLTAPQHRVLDGAYALLADSALAQPQVWVHRDYHSRNLMLTDVNNPGILDFQDAVRGPVTYDLVSLLRDCYVAWPCAQVRDWVTAYYALARQSSIPVGDDEQLFVRWFDWMGMQRHLKATGIFARLKHRDGKPVYLNDIPRTLSYVHQVSAAYPELAGLRALLAELKLPGCSS